MHPPSLLALAADVVALIHLAVVLFNVGGLVLILIGRFAAWRWVRSLWFRVVHLAAVGVVAALAWLGQLCPLTVIEQSLRARAGEAGYAGSFVAYWLHELLYYDAPAWMFTLAYSTFMLLVAACWFWVRPGRG